MKNKYLIYVNYAINMHKQVFICVLRNVTVTMTSVIVWEDV